jgi:hypothetical protein
VQVPNSGSFILGGVDSADYTGDIIYQPVTTEGYWETQCGGIEVDGQVVSATNNMFVAWDSGTSLAYIPERAAAAVASALNAQLDSELSSTTGGNLYVLPCSSFNGLSVSVSFGGKSFSWSNADLNGGAVDSRRQNCAINIIGSNTQDPVGNPMAIIDESSLQRARARLSGCARDSFLKNVVAVFDFDGSRVGMATASGNNPAGSSTSSNDNSSGSNSSSSASPLGLSSTLSLLGVTALLFLAL